MFHYDPDVMLLTPKQPLYKVGIKLCAYNPSELQSRESRAIGYFITISAIYICQREKEEETEQTETSNTNEIRWKCNLQSTQSKSTFLITTSHDLSVCIFFSVLVVKAYRPVKLYLHFR